jgi:hypothetical protein
MLSMLTCGRMFADSISIYFVPNDGSGGNFGAVEYGGGMRLQIGGGTPADFYSYYPGYAPGSTLGGFTTTDLYVDWGTLQVGPNSYQLESAAVGTLFLSSITFPTNGQDFTALVDVEFSDSMFNLDTNQPFDVGGGATGRMTFHYLNGVYYPDSAGFINAPEPNTLALMGTGLAGILAFGRRTMKAHSARRNGC